MTYVLVHSPLVGPMTWQPLAGVLRKQGERALVPSIAGILEGEPPYHARLAARVAAAIEGDVSDDPVVIVVHSGAGALVPAIVEDIARTVVGLVFVDAQLPRPGRRWVDTAPPEVVEDLRRRCVAGRLPPWNEWFPPEVIAASLPSPEQRNRFLSELPRLPMSYFEEPAPATEAWQGLPRAYLQTSPAYAAAAAEASAAGFLVQIHPGDHLSVVTQPMEVAARIRELVSALARAASAGTVTAAWPASPRR
jgi:hypothetical protein